MYGFYKTALVTALIAACSVLMSSALTAEPRSTPTAGENNSIVYPTGSKGILSQCGDYFTFNPKPEAFGVVPPEYTGNSVPVPPMLVPVYGYMVDHAFNVDEAMKRKQGDNPYNIAEINRAMWDGITFIWLSAELPPETYASVQSYANNWNKIHEKKVIALTWNDELSGKDPHTGRGKEIPANREFAFSAWNTSQSCMSFSEGAFTDFMQRAVEHNAGRDTSILPKATLTDGKLHG